VPSGHESLAKMLPFPGAIVKLGQKIGAARIKSAEPSVRLNAREKGIPCCFIDSVEHARLRTDSPAGSGEAIRRQKGFGSGPSPLEACRGCGCSEKLKDFGRRGRGLRKSSRPG